MAHPKLCVQAHRGACSERMENSMPAFERALELGVQSIELDIHLSRDHEVMVIHDPFVLLNERKQPVISLSASELQSLIYENRTRLRSSRSLLKTETRIPTLKEVCLRLDSILSKSQDFFLDVEIKRDEKESELYGSADILAESVLKVLKSSWPRKSVIRSFDLQCLKAVRQLDPEQGLAFLTCSGLENWKEISADLQVEIWAPELESLGKKDIAPLQKAGLKIIPWTLNTEEAWEKALKIGADGLTTDDPQGCFRYLAQKRKRKS
jgi:glycerophosphoryl diester phosphodiesterase